MEGQLVDPTNFKSLVESIRYSPTTRSNILYGVGFISNFMESPILAPLQVAKRILSFIKEALEYDISTHLGTHQHSLNSQKCNGGKTT